MKGSLFGLVVWPSSTTDASGSTESRGARRQLRDPRASRALQVVDSQRRWGDRVAWGHGRGGGGGAG